LTDAPKKEDHSFSFPSIMKPCTEYLAAIRHIESEYNALDKRRIPGYKDFESLFDEEYSRLSAESEQGSFPSEKLLELAKPLVPALTARQSDYNTPVLDSSIPNAIETGKRLKEYLEVPDKVVVSPYLRTQLSLKALQTGWPELTDVSTFTEPRIREQEYGKRAAINDWKLYTTLNPEQAWYRKMASGYEYRHDGGESFLDLRERVRDFLQDSTRIQVLGMLNANTQAPGKILLVTHHLTIMAIRSLLEGWDRETFLRLDRDERPPNCSVTTYTPSKAGSMRLSHKNLVLSK
jgi:broad specificity phosphatase PhoE